MIVPIVVTALIVTLLLGSAWYFQERKRRHSLAGVTRVAQQLVRGEAVNQLPPSVGPESDELFAALNEVVEYLEQVSQAAAAIASGQHTVPISPRSEADQLSHSLRTLSRQQQELVRVATRIKEGDDEVELPQSTTRGSFMNAFAEMTRSLLQRVEQLTASERHNRQLAETLASTRQRLEHLLGSSPAMIYSRAASVYADFTFISKNVTQLLGYAVEDFLTSGFWVTRVHPDDSARVSAELTRGLETSSGNLEYRFLHANGTYRWMHDGFRLMRDLAGQPLEIIGWLVDVTEQKETESALAEIEGHLRQAQKMEAIGTLAGGVAHDFNNLLTAIRGGAELLLDSLKEHDLRTEVLEIQKAADRAAKLTRQLLAFSRNQVLRPEVIDLNSVVSEMLNMLQRLLLNEAVSLEFERSPGTANVFADPGQLEQVVLNLVVNARDAMPRGGSISIRVNSVQVSEGGAQPITLDPGSYVLLTVTDTGTGMDKETQARIFEPFFTTKEKGKGTGLGLATVYGIVRQSGGDIAVDSTPGQGTTFAIYLPATAAAAEVVRDEVDSRRQTGSEAILLVDDEDAVRTLVGRVLKRNGYRVYQASSGKEALEVLKTMESPIDLMITDLAMPEMSGRELAGHVYELKPETRVLYVSGYERTEAELDGTGALPEGSFLQKPFSVQQLALKVREVLDAA